MKILYTKIGPTGGPYKKGDWEKCAIHNEKEIKGFFGEYRFLSNFWPAQIVLDTVQYRSVELAYQAAKWSPGKREYFLNCSELESIDYNRTNTPDGYTPEEWDRKKFEIMKDLIQQKFDSNINPENYQKLLQTGNRYLEELNWWGDTYWGTDQKGNGQNMLGKILMEVREQVLGS